MPKKQTVAIWESINSNAKPKAVVGDLLAMYNCHRAHPGVFSLQVRTHANQLIGKELKDLDLMILFTIKCTSYLM